MALSDLELELDFDPLHTLAVAAYWVEWHCVVPDGFQRGEPFDLVVWQALAFLNAYRVKPSATVGQFAPAFFYRRSQIVLPQKAGKAPHTSSRICLEGVGPALFAGWARGGELYRCSEHGCGCGWTYEYSPGEAMGQPWPTPLIQISATSEDQTDNIYAALRPMIDEGPLHELIPKTGEEFIRLPNGGRIDVVTSNATSRLGQRVTFCAQDETGIWTASNGMVKVAETQRRGLAGMGGRAEETTNAWDPNVGSVAQRTAEAADRLGDIFRIHPLPPRSLSYRNKEQRRKIHRLVYEGCPWVDLDAIEAEAAELIAVDPGQAERFFGNRPVAGSGIAFDVDKWKKLRAPRQVPRHAVVVLGVDGALRDDALAVVACEVKTGYMWPVTIVERPEGAGEDYKHDLDAVDGAVLDVFERYQVWRAYCDPQYIDELTTAWQNRWGDKRVVEWLTYRPRPIAWAVRGFTTEAHAVDEDNDGHVVLTGQLRHDGNETMRRHIENAHKKPLTVLDDKEQAMHSLCKEHDKSAKKIDAAMAAVLAWEARTDCIAKGGEMLDEHVMPVAVEPERWVPGSLPSQDWMKVPAATGPMGDLS